MCKPLALHYVYGMRSRMWFHVLCKLPIMEIMVRTSYFQDRYIQSGKYGDIQSGKYVIGRQIRKLT